MLIADEYLVYVSMPLAGSCLFDVVDNPSVKGLMFAADIRLAAVSELMIELMKLTTVMPKRQTAGSELHCKLLHSSSAQQSLHHADSCTHEMSPRMDLVQIQLGW